jgi:putative ABC transport system permease protein
LSYVPLSLADLALALLLVLANGAISVLFHLGFERQLALAVTRMALQLALVGYGLKLVLAQGSAAWTSLAVAVMAAIAGGAIWPGSPSGRLGWRAGAAAAASVLIVGALTSAYIVGVVMGLEPWYAPRFFLPILGLLLGSTLSSVGLALDDLANDVRSQRLAIEARLALGASRWQAMAPVTQRALRRALMPVLLAMAASGAAVLPGLMAGQVISGVDPFEAAKYQIVIWCGITGATAVAALLATLGGLRALTDRRHRVRLDRLVEHPQQIQT